jgi:hypothetical protein
MELNKEPRGGAPDSPVRKRLAARDERAGLRGEYEILFDEVSYLKVHQLHIYICLSAGGLRRRRERWARYTYMAQHKLRMAQHNLCIRHDTSYVYIIRYAYGRHKICSP